MIQNMRDLGGIQTTDGKMIRRGMLVRSAQLGQAEEHDLDGVSAIIDLRSPGERLEIPDLFYSQEYLPIPVIDDLTAGITHEEGSRDRGIPDMAYLYGRMMRECTESFRRILLAIMQHDYSTGAILWHCTEGKDRCGMTAALVLEALGVDRKMILEDYLKTNIVNLPKATAIREELIGTRGKEFADSVYRAYLADERYIRAAWEAMGNDYIHEQLRIEDSQLCSFRNMILE